MKSKLSIKGSQLQASITKTPVKLSEMESCINIFEQLDPDEKIKVFEELRFRINKVLDEEGKKADERMQWIKICYEKLLKG